MDGGFSNNLPTLDESTITVSPFCGETDICPRDASSQLFHVSAYECVEAEYFPVDGLDIFVGLYLYCHDNE